MKGCDSHRLSLAVMETLGHKEKRSRAGSIAQHGEEFQLTAAKKDAAIIQNKHFENAIYKTQAGLEGSMNQQEKSSVKIFLKPVVDDAEVGDEREPTEEEDYADRALRVAEQRKRRRVSASKRRPTDHASPTTNVVE